MKTSARRRRRWLAIIGLAVAVAIAALFAVLRLELNGDALADNIASILNKRMRGRIEIGSVEWSTSSLKTLATGGWIPLTVRDVRVWDDCALSAVVADETVRTSDPNTDCTPDDRPDANPGSHRKPRKLLVRTDLITVELDAHALMFGNHDIVLRHLWLHGGEGLLEQTREPNPLTAYDHTVLSIVSAFFPRQAASFHAGIFADTRPPTFDLRDIHIAGLNLTLHMAPAPGATADQVAYAFTARLEGVNVDTDEQPASRSYLYVDSSDPLVGKFYVRLAVTAQRGTMRLVEQGARAAFRLPAVTAAGSPPEAYPPPGRTAAYQIELTDIKLDRLAQLPSNWASRDVVANTLEIDLSAHAQPCGSAPAAEAAALHLSGELFNYYDRPFDGAWNLKLDAKNLGPTVASCISPIIGGRQLDGAISLTGPFVAPPAIGLDLSGVDLDVPVGKDQLAGTIAELHGKIDLVNEEGYIEKTRALIHSGQAAETSKPPGEVDLSATFGLNPLYSNALVEIVKPIDVGKFLPKQLASSVGGYLQGRIRAISATKAASRPSEELPPAEHTELALQDFDLSLGMTPHDRAIRLHHGSITVDKDKFDIVHIDGVYLDAGQSHAEFNGKIDLATRDMDVRIDGQYPDLDVWLRRFGLPALVKSAGGGGIRLTGPITNPQVYVTDTLLAGIPCIDKLQIGSLERTGDTITVSKLSTPGLGGQISGGGTLRLGGSTPVIERLDIAGQKLDAAKLCGLKGAVRGTIDELDAHVQGALDLKRSPLDWLALGQVKARADHLTVLGDRYSAITACINRKDDASCRARPALVRPDDLQQCEAGKRAAPGGSGFCVVASASRDAGGTLDATVAQLPAARPSPRSFLPVRLTGVVAVSDLPLALIDLLRGKPDARSVGGLASIILHLQGAPTAPQAEGAIQVLRSWIASGFLGDAQIALAPTTVRGVPGLAFQGSALAGRLTITGSLGTTAPYPLELSISGRRIEVDPFLDLHALVGQDDPVQAWASGTITVRTELAPQRPVQPEAWIELTELVAQLDHRASDGRITPLVIRLKEQDDAKQPALSLYVTPSTIELACRDAKATGGRSDCSTTFETPAGNIVLSGHAELGSQATQRVELKAKGDLDLANLRPLLDQRFDLVAGKVRLDASIAGALDLSPASLGKAVEASLDLDPDQVWEANEAERTARRTAARARIKRAQVALRPENPVTLRPINSNTVLTAPHGLIKLAHGSIGFTDVVIQVKDKEERRDADAGELHIAGTIDLLSGGALNQPRWSLLLSGKLPGQLLQVLAPKAVAQANGLIKIADNTALMLSGTGTTPELTGTLEFDHFSVIPRGGRRELSLEGGTIDINTATTTDHRLYTLDIADVRGAFDDGRLSNIRGSVTLRDGELASTDVSLDASSIPFRIPGTLDLLVSATDVHVTLASASSDWRVGGTITVIDGAFLQNFEISDQIQTIGVNTPPSVPFWEAYPALGAAKLNLQLNVQQFALRDNLATIEFRGDGLAINGTPRDPRLAGTIRVNRGQFRIPGTRADFVRMSGTVDFTDTRKASNPDLNITAEADYHDLSGQDHLITATFVGSLAQPTWDLRTSTGYNKSQTILLLFFGRNQEQLRRSLGDANVGSDPTRVDPTTNPSQGFAEQIVKDLAGDWVSGLLGTSLTRLTGLDVLRIEIGVGSIGFHVEKRFLENAKAVGDVEQSIRGTTVKGVAEFKTPFSVSLQAGYLSQNYYDPAEQDIKDVNVKLVYRVFIP